MTSRVPQARLAEEFGSEGTKTREAFERTGDGRQVLAERTAAVDHVIAGLFGPIVAPGAGGAHGFCVVALGGYGRRELFPHSDIDLLFLASEEGIRARNIAAAAELCRHLWDWRLRVSQSVRLLEECDRLHADNLEFNVALLDSRYVTGDAALFAELSERVIPRVTARERRDLVANLTELTELRHAKYGNTMFHLEPNLKDAPGGLRDHHVAHWLAMIAGLGKDDYGKNVLAEVVLREECGNALDFLSAARCLLHYRQGRDDNILSYQMQAEAAARGLGMAGSRNCTPEEWMRSYFRHARSIYTLTMRLLEEPAPPRPSIYAKFEELSGRFSKEDFYVRRDRVVPRETFAAGEPASLLRLFEFVAREGKMPNAEAERRIEEALRIPPKARKRTPELGRKFRALLSLPFAAQALQAMHHLGLLVWIVPEFQAIDALVVRDFHHRYTVDEHTFQTIHNLHQLRAAESAIEKRFGEILDELERPDLLFLALFFHDVGKGASGTDHIAASLRAVERAFPRLDLDAAEQETVRWMIALHLEMSSTLQRRDIFDPETVRAFARIVETPERLKMLCLLTYADIRAVHPDALTPWKAEMLWQLYAETANDLNRSVDDERFHAAGGAVGPMKKISALLSKPSDAKDVESFLEGFPRRYLATRTPEEVAQHIVLAKKLEDSSPQVKLERRGQNFRLTVVARDRPRLFTTLVGALTGWGMNIVKADAFANASGVVLDTFDFVDRYRTLELNPTEMRRFQSSIEDVVAQRTDVQTLLRGRMKTHGTAAKVAVDTIIRTDDESSTHSTLLEVVTHDRPGLLYQVSECLANLGANIEVALVDTEGQKAIDVFYLTRSGKKLSAQEQATLHQALRASLTPA